MKLSRMIIFQVQRYVLEELQKIGKESGLNSIEQVSGQQAEQNNIMRETFSFAQFFCIKIIITECILSILQAVLTL